MWHDLDVVRKQNQDLLPDGFQTEGWRHLDRKSFLSIWANSL